ncbi:Cysteine--tRNA ligase [uncultured archaeon]|nr:Cysteine--tRNA ligase [uncultured archaeon]
MFMLKLYNTLTNKIEEISNEKEIGYYTCGPTVYNYAHIGNLRTYTLQDLLKRFLLFEGYKVKQVMNLTDVDDKTIRDSQKEGKSLKEYTRFYEKAFLQDLKKLNILTPEVICRATEHIEDMVSKIEELKKKGYAYEKDGSTYYSITKFKNYGKLSKIKLENLKANTELKDEYDKENPSDFALWKAWNKADGKVFWETELGKGRPGWHIECSAMSRKYLGDTFELHSGGVDLIFPHHENEIAQSEAATGKPFVKHWYHIEHLLVNDQKMAKSLKNFYTLRDIEDKKIPTYALRFFFISAHYKTRLNFTWESLESAMNSVKSMIEAYALLLNYSKKVKKHKSKELEAFTKELENDLNTPEAIAVVFKKVKEIKNDIATYDVERASKDLYFLKEVDKVLGVLEYYKDKKLTTKQKELLEERNRARKAKDYTKADELRKELNKDGLNLKDTGEKTLYYFEF